MYTHHVDSPNSLGENKSKFQDFSITLDNIVDYEVTTRGKVILYVNKDNTVNKIVIRNSALSQFLKLLYDKVRNAKKLIIKNPEALRAKLIERLNEKSVPIIVSAIEVEPNVYVAYRVTSEEYTPVPHRILFEFVEGVLKQHNVEFTEKKVIKFFKRTAMVFKIYETPLNYSRPDDELQVYLVVSNANNARDAIHIYTTTFIKKCENGVVMMDAKASSAIVHKGNIAQILMKVEKAVIEVINKTRKIIPQLAKKIEELESIPVTEDIIWLWLRMLIEKHRVPKKYRRWLQNIMRQYIMEFGANAEAMFQTLTYFVTRLQNKNTDIAERLNREATKLLEQPIQYIQAIKGE